MRIKYIVDASAGITKEEAKKKGLGFLPLFLYIEEKEYKSGIDINSREFYKMINLDSNVRTSNAPVSSFEEVYSKYSKEYDYVLVYTISKSISAQMQNAKIAAKKFKNVVVIESKGVGFGIINDIEQLKKYAQNCNDIKQIIKKANYLSKKHLGFLIPGHLSWLVKGGRVPSALAKIANIVKIIPIILFEKGVLKPGGRGIKIEKTLLKAIKILKSKVDPTKMFLYFYHSGDNNQERLLELVKSNLGKDIKIMHFPSIIGAHVGPNSFAIMVSKK